MKDHKITVTITQEFTDGTTRECKSALCNSDQHDEPQGDIGATAANALLQILAAQNTGCDVEFWIPFFNQMLGMEGGQWLYRLSRHAELWWDQTDNVETFSDFMCRFITSPEVKSCQSPP